MNSHPLPGSLCWYPDLRGWVFLFLSARDWVYYSPAAPVSLTHSSRDVNRDSTHELYSP